MNSATITRNSLAEAVNLTSGTTVSGILYKFVILYCLSARLSYPQLWNLDGKIKWQTVFTMTLASLMMTCVTIDVALSNIEIRITYVDYGTLPGGPLGLAAGLHAATVTRVRALVILVDSLLISGVLVSFFASYLRSTPSFIQVWRVLALWSGTPFVRPITLLLYVTYAGEQIPSFDLSTIISF
jgi:LytS/YehU family sensor histidine kinase